MNEHKIHTVVRNALLYLPFKIEYAPGMTTIPSPSPLTGAAAVANE